MAESQERRSNGSSEPSEPELGDLIQNISDDLKVLAHDEMELARIELAKGMRRPIADAGAIILGGVVALIALGLLCTTAVVALQPLVPPLWLRMLIMSFAYFALGGLVAGRYMLRLRREGPPDMTRTVHEAQRTAQALKGEFKQ